MPRFNRLQVLPLVLLLTCIVVAWAAAMTR